MTCHGKVYQLFLYMPHTKKIKVISKILYFIVYTKKTLTIYFTPHYRRKKYIKHNLKALLFINSTFQLTLDDSKTPKKLPYKKLWFIYESVMFNVHYFEILVSKRGGKTTRPDGMGQGDVTALRKPHRTGSENNKQR